MRLPCVSISPQKHSFHRKAEGIQTDEGWGPNVSGSLLGWVHVETVLQPAHARSSVPFRLLSVGPMSSLGGLRPAPAPGSEACSHRALPLCLPAEPGFHGDSPLLPQGTTTLGCPQSGARPGPPASPPRVLPWPSSLVALTSTKRNRDRGWGPMGQLPTSGVPINDISEGLGTTLFRAPSLQPPRLPADSLVILSGGTRQLSGCLHTALLVSKIRG